jgi:hypothetical protein
VGGPSAHHRRPAPTLLVYLNGVGVWTEAPLKDGDARLVRARWDRLREGAHRVALFGAHKCINCEAALARDSKLEEAVEPTVRPANRVGMRGASAMECETFSMLLRANAVPGARTGVRQLPSSEVRSVGRARGPERSAPRTSKPHLRGGAGETPWSTARARRTARRRSWPRK